MAPSHPSFPVPGADPLALVGADAELARLRDLLMHAPAMVWILRGPAHVVELANEPARQAAAGAAELIGRRVGEAMPDLARQGVHALMDHVYATGEPQVAEEVRLLVDPGRDGLLEERFSRFVLHPTLDADGAVDGILALAVDVTDQVRARHRAETLAGEAQRARADLDLMLARERAARAAAEAAGERARFLAEAGVALDAPIGVEARLERLARLIVPRLADLCAVWVGEGRGDGGSGAPRLVALAHADPERERFAIDLQGRVSLPPDRGIARVMDSGRAEVLSQVTDEMLAAEAPDAGLLDLRGLAARSAMRVPLVARGQTLGVIVLASGRPGRYGADDLALAEELARRAALALDNARLLDAEREAREEAERAGDRLARLQKVTASLARALTREEVAAVFVREGMGALQADAGLVAMLLDRRCQTLASAGYPPQLEEDLRRFPLEAPFPLAEAMRTGQPIWLESNEDWRTRFGRPRAPLPTGMAVPLIVRRRIIGAIGFRFTASDRRFDADERAFVQTLAEQCAQALERAGRYEAEHQLALTLQRSLLPQTLPEFPGITFAVRYLSAADVAEAGGDWYEAIALPGGRVGLSVGDAVGHDARAAAVMGQLRSALRAYAIEGASPAEVLRRLSRFAEGVEGARVATVVYAILDPAAGELLYGCAGHPPPLLMSADGEVEYLEGGRGAPLAALSGLEFSEARAAIGPGATLILYSDGVVERRGEPLDAGLARLAAAAPEAAGADPETLADHLLERALSEGSPRDDVALLVVSLLPRSQEPLHLRAPARLSELAAIRTAVRVWLARAGVRGDVAADLLLACGEACANAAEHAYDAEPGSLELDLERERSGAVRLTVRDFGSWKMPSPVLGDRGRGLRLMRLVMDGVEIVRGDGGTVVTMVRGEGLRSGTEGPR
jgi:serine phosphatase RsbU (regulator of sigma subunit)/anti-sigma regulatory factor (Ser/Thr protein kinase)